MNRLPLLVPGIVFFALAALAQPTGEEAPARHVVVMVWDGMRPDFVMAGRTPNLWKLAKGGVTFRRHHPVYPSSTEVNGTAMATGDYPERSGIMANREYRPGVDPLKSITTEAPATIQASGSGYIAVPTLAETLRKAGYSTAVAGSKGVALLQDWRQALDASGSSANSEKSVLLAAGKTWPADERAKLDAVLGPWPETVEFPNIPEDQWTTRALTEQFWKDAVPAFSLLWLSDPDYSQHQMSPGSPLALAALKSADDRLGTVLAALDAKGVRQDTDVFVVSDHGFSTISEPNDVPAMLNATGFKASRDAFDHPPQPGEILAVGNGGSAMFYITGKDEETGRRLVEFLQKQAFTGVIFSRWKLPGTFALHDVRINTPNAPDVVLSFRWTDGVNRYGAPGMLEADWGRSRGKGSHASLSRFEMNNTLIAAGPDFRKGAFDDLSTGNVDLAPTVLHILGVRPVVPMDGRILAEALVRRNSGGKLETSSRVLKAQAPGQDWSQYLKISEVGRTEYFDEGNGDNAIPPR